MTQSQPWRPHTLAAPHLFGLTRAPAGKRRSRSRHWRRRVPRQCRQAARAALDHRPARSRRESGVRRPTPLARAGRQSLGRCCACGCTGRTRRERGARLRRPAGRRGWRWRTMSRCAAGCGGVAGDSS
eukprot:361196-Chlamydomonas_euryale.AAC.2